MRKYLLAATAAMALATAADAQEVRISMGSYNLNNLPFMVAEGLDLYTKTGLDVTVENFASGGSKTLQALVAGSTDIAVGFYDHTIQMQSQNKDVVAIVDLSRNSGLVLAGGTDSTFDPAKPETIKGAKIGITAPGSSVDFEKENLDGAIRLGDGQWPRLEVDQLIANELTPLCAPAYRRKLDLKRPEDLTRARLLHTLVRFDDWRFWLESVGVGGIDAYAGDKFASSTLSYQAALEG